MQLEFAAAHLMYNSLRFKQIYRIWITLSWKSRVLANFSNSEIAIYQETLIGIHHVLVKGMNLFTIGKA